MVPRARVSLPLGGRLVVELAVFGAAAAALCAAGHPALAVALGALAVANRFLINRWEQDERMRGGQASGMTPPSPNQGGT